MGINEWEVENDKFEPEYPAMGLSFPCNCCKYKHGEDTDHPCSECGHNLNAVSQG
jgi:hypothetical protein